MPPIPPPVDRDDVVHAHKQTGLPNGHLELGTNDDDGRAMVGNVPEQALIMTIALRQQQPELSPGMNVLLEGIEQLTLYRRIPIYRRPWISEIVAEVTVQLKGLSVWSLPIRSPGCPGRTVRPLSSVKADIIAASHLYSLIGIIFPRS